MGTHKATLEEDAGIQRTNPRHRRSTRQRRANGVVPSPNQTLRAGGADYMAGRMGSPKGKLGSVSPFFSFISVFSVPLCYTETHPYSYFSALTLSLSLTCTTIVSLSLVSTTLPPPPLIYSGICGDASLAPPEMPKMGTQLLDRGLGPRPCASHPLPIQTALLPHTQLILNQ